MLYEIPSNSHVSPGRVRDRNTGNGQAHDTGNTADGRRNRPSDTFAITATNTNCRAKPTTIRNKHNDANRTMRQFMRRHMQERREHGMQRNRTKHLQSKMRRHNRPISMHRSLRICRATATGVQDTIRNILLSAMPSKMQLEL